MSDMRDSDMPLLDRISEAVRRVITGRAQMRVPVEATDSDIVLLDCKAEITKLRADLAAEIAGRDQDAQQYRADLAREREAHEQTKAALAAAQADAERYRWLRECTGPILAGMPTGEVSLGVQWLDTTDLDAAIDAARAAGRHDA